VLRSVLRSRNVKNRNVEFPGAWELANFLDVVRSRERKIDIKQRISPCICETWFHRKYKHTGSVREMIGEKSLLHSLT